VELSYDNRKYEFHIDGSYYQIGKKKRRKGRMKRKTFLLTKNEPLFSIFRSISFLTQTLLE
jgi:hypothetical protein